jgi:glycoside/pentoside/hexuronide:cation symporter, GPH family
MEKLSFKEKLGFGFGQYAGSGIWQVFMFFLPFFYTDIFGISAITVSIMFTIVRVLDAVFDPIVGIIADRTNTRWGKFRPYILWFTIPFGVGSVLMFTTPHMESGKIIYAFITYTLMMIVYSLLMVPFNSLTGVITSESKERTSLSSYGFVFAYLASLVVLVSKNKLVEFFGHGDKQLGYQLTILTFAVISVIFLYISFFSIKERVHPDPSVKASVKEDIKDLMSNKPWVILFLASFFALIYICLRSAVVEYYFTYYVQREDLMPWFLGIGTLMVMIGVFPTNWLSKVMGKKNAFIFVILIIAVSQLMFFFASPTNYFLIFLAQILFSLASGPTMPLLWSMYADAADYSEWKSGRRATGLIYSASILAQKIGTIGGSLAMVVLVLFHYKAKVAQTAESLLGIKLTLSIFPAIIALVVAAIFMMYDLDKNKLAQIETDLAQRRKDRGN